MRNISIRILMTTGLMALVLTPLTSFAQGAGHFEWSTYGDPIVDYNDCTDEMVDWLVSVRETFMAKENRGGRGHYMDHWLFQGTVEGHDTGYVWKTRGIVHIVGSYSIDGSLTGGEAVLENAYMKPVTPGAPRMRLDVKSSFRFNAAGNMVAERFVYTYHCVGN